MSRFSIAAMRVPELLLILLFTASCAAMGSSGTGGGSSAGLVLQDGKRISGSIRAKRIVIPSGITIIVEDDVILHATEELLVQGTLQCSDRSSADSKTHGPRIELVSDRSIVVLGVVRGGKGQCYDELPREKSLGREGGAGSSILLHAPSVAIAGTVAAGNGGNGGRGGNGGSGGCVCRIGSDGMNAEISAQPHAPPVFAGGIPGNCGQGDWNYHKGKVGTVGSWGSNLEFSSVGEYRAAHEAHQVPAFPSVVGHNAP